MKVAEVRVPHARLIAAAAALVACAGIAYLTRTYTFYFDEWNFILTAPDWTVATYLQPHNEHPAMLPRAIYALLLNTVGLRSYLPYMGVLFALHATTAVLLFELVRRRAGDAAGLASAALLLVLGAGWENLLWAFQLSFVGSVACGLGMLLALESRRMWLATALLAGALMFSGIGLVFGVAAAVRLAVPPERRKGLLWLAPVALMFGAWYVLYGRGSSTNLPAAAGNIAVLPLYVLSGLWSSLAGIIGQGGLFGPAVLVLALAAIALSWRRHRPDAFALGIAVALVSFYVLTGLSRAQLGYQQSAAGRYIYEGAVLWLLLLADAARDLPWRGTWRPALIACLFLACFSSSVLLYTYAIAKSEQMRRETADLQALAAERTNRCLDPNGIVDQLVMPQLTRPELYYRAIDRYGDPVAGRPAVGDAELERAKANLLTAGCP